MIISGKNKRVRVDFGGLVSPVCRTPMRRNGEDIRIKPHRMMVGLDIDATKARGAGS